MKCLPGHPLSPHVPLVNAIRSWQVFTNSSSSDTVCVAVNKREKKNSL